MTDMTIQEVELALARARRREPIGWDSHVIRFKDCKSCGSRGYWLLNPFIPDLNMLCSPNNALQCVSCAKAYLKHLRAAAETAAKCPPSDSQWAASDQHNILTKGEIYPPK